MAAEGPVRVHVRHHVDDGLVQQVAADRVGVVQEALEEAFRGPFGHGLAGVLAGDDPDRLLAVAGLSDR